MKLEDITKAFEENPELISGVVSHIETTDIGKRMIQTKVDAQVDEKIDEKTRNIYGGIDNDMDTILGERPQRGDDGKKEKTYEKAKALFTELAELRKQKESLSKDKKVQELETKLAELENTDVVQQVREQFDTAKQTWQEEKQTLMDQINAEKQNNQTFQKQALLNEGFSGIQYNPDVSESIRKMVENNERKALLEKSEIRDGKLVFLDENNKVILNKTTYEPENVQGMLARSENIREISLKNENKGGQAKPEVQKVQKINVEGKDTKKLNLDPGSFKTKSEFIKVAEDTLTKSGITRDHEDFARLKDEAYKEHNVKELPAE